MVLCKALGLSAAIMKDGGVRQAAHPVTIRCPAPQLRAQLVRAAAAAAVEKTTLGPNNSPLAAPGSPCQAMVGLPWAREEANSCSPWVGLAEIPWELWAPLVEPQTNWHVIGRQMRLLLLLCCGPHGNGWPFSPLQSW